MLPIQKSCTVYLPLINDHLCVGSELGKRGRGMESLFLANALASVSLLWLEGQHCMYLIFFSLKVTLVRCRKRKKTDPASACLGWLVFYNSFCPRQGDERPWGGIFLQSTPPPLSLCLLRGNRQRGYWRENSCG